MDKRAMAVRAAQWRQIIEEATHSDLTKSEWCQLNGVSIRSFMRWQKQFRDEELEKLRVPVGESGLELPDIKKQAPAFEDITPCLQMKAGPSLGKDTTVASMDPQIMINTGSCQIYVAGSANEDLVRRVMRALRDVE